MRPSSQSLGDSHRRREVDSLVSPHDDLRLLVQIHVQNGDPGLVAGAQLDRSGHGQRTGWTGLDDGYVVHALPLDDRVLGYGEHWLAWSGLHGGSGKHAGPQSTV